MGPALLKSEARSRHKVTDRPRYQYFVGSSEGTNPGPNMHCNTSERFADHLAFSSVSARANVNAELPDRVHNCSSEADRTRRAVKCRQKSRRRPYQFRDLDVLQVVDEPGSDVE